MKKGAMCATCGKMIQTGAITKEGKNFCCQACCDKPKKKNICEFC